MSKKQAAVVALPVNMEAFVAKLTKRGVKINESLIALCRESYKGGPLYINSTNLFTHTRENADDYEHRKKRAYFLNYTAPVIDTYSFFLFKASISRVYDDKELILSQFIENCDKKGTGLTEFMKSITAKFLVAGDEWIVVDVPNIETKTKIDELKANKRPYVYTILREDILDYEEDDNGFVWVKYYQRESTKGDSWDYEGTGTKRIITIWSRGKYETYEENGTLITSQKLNINFVPFIQVKYADGEPLIKDIVFINRALFNWCSLLDEIIYRQTFSWLVVPGDKDETLSEKKIGTAWAWTFNPESKHLPTFISPDVSQANLIQSQIKVAIEEIYRLASLDWSLNQISTKSGVAKAYDFMNVNKALAAIAFALQEAEKRIFKFISMYHASPTMDVESLPNFDDTEVTKPLDITIKYPTDFSFVSLSDQMDEYYEALTQSFSPKFAELIAKQISEALLPMISEEDRKTIYKEIEDSYNQSLMDQYGSGDANLGDQAAIDQATIDSSSASSADVSTPENPAKGVPAASDVSVQ